MKKIYLAILLTISSNCFAQLVTLPPSPATKNSSTADQQAWSIYQMQQNSLQAYKTLSRGVTANFNLVFHNSLGLTPAQMSAAMGTSACGAHMMFLAASTMLNNVVLGSFTLTEPCTITCNQDGTTTVTACQ